MQEGTQVSTSTTQPTGTLIAMSRGIPLATYVEDGFHPIEKARLDDVEYEKVLRSKTLANVDVVFINPTRRTFYLAWRRALPMTGWFWMGGNTGDINATLIDKMREVIKRETRLEVSADRLVLQKINEYFWKDRAQKPTDMGCHIAGLTYSLAVTAEEVQRITLDPNEYDLGILREFTRDQIVAERLYPSIIDLYDLIFPAPRPSIFGQITLAHEDERRALNEFNSNDFRVQIFEFKDSERPGGKHAHAKFFEVFTILKGGGFVLTCQVDASGKQMSPIKRHNLAVGSVARMEPFTAHTFYLKRGTKLHCYASAAYDPTDFIKADFLVA
jgi:hypothetical protein